MTGTHDAERCTIGWDEGEWRNPPARSSIGPDGALQVEAVEGSDAWQKTSYGFVRDSEHALLRPLEPGTAIEVDYLATMTEQFDQAGLLIRLDSEHWIKAGTEYADNALRLGAVVTHEYSDWSSAPVGEWAGRQITIRASWADDAVTIRAGLVGEPLQFVRLAHWPARPGSPVLAGPYLCAPTRPGFETEILGWRVTPADRGLH